MKILRPIGILKLKMRLRKPITEALRFHRDLTEAKTSTRDKNVTLYN
jgi:hypothetical protein